MLSLHVFLRKKSAHLAACLVLAMSSMIACASGFEPDGASDSRSSDTEQWSLVGSEGQEVLEGFGMAAMPEFFAIANLGICTTDDESVAYASVEVLDGAGDPVSGVVVYGAFAAHETGQLHALTDSRGMVAFASPVQSGASELEFRVDSIAFELGDDIAFVRPASLIEKSGCPLANGVGTSTGATDDGVGTSTGATDDGVGTNASLTADDVGINTGVTGDPDTHAK